MRQYKTVSGGYLVSIGIGINGEEITNKEYCEILSIIRNKPKAREGFGFRLKTDLTWEEYALPPIEPNPPTDEEALTRYVNTITGQNNTDIISATETLITNIIKEDM